MEYQDAVRYLTKAHVDALLSLGGVTRKSLEKCIRGFLSELPEDWIIANCHDHEVIQRHVHLTPTRPGTYLKLLHGRSPIDEVLESWGADGPWIGPLEWFYCTHMTFIGLGFMDGEVVETLSQDTVPPAPIYFFGGMIYFDGVYYSDWEIQRLAPSRKTQAIKHKVDLPSRQRRLFESHP